MTTPTMTMQTGTTTWKIDPVHSVAEFKVRHMMISNVKGQFTVITGSMTLDPKDITKSRIEASVDSDSLNTRDAQRDAHLKSPDFFDVEKYPKLTLASTRVARKREGELAVTGNLTIHGVTRSGLRRGGADASPKRPVEQYTHRCFSNREDQPQRVRPHMECATGSRRLHGGR